MRKSIRERVASWWDRDGNPTNEFCFVVSVLMIGFDLVVTHNGTFTGNGAVFIWLYTMSAPIFVTCSLINHLVALFQRARRQVLN